MSTESAPEPHSVLESHDATPSPEATASVSRPAFRDTRLRPALCCAGALGVGMVLAPLVLRPSAAPATVAGAVLPEIALPSESTLVVTPALPPGALIRGRLVLVAGATDAVGRARVGGQIARQLVENGARVERGDAIIEISSGVARRVAPVSERRQNRAEQSQIAASNAQNALAQKISIAQTQLRAAQERVARSQSQVGAARDVVRRLQNGQSVASSEIPAPLREAAPLANPSSSRSRRRKRRRARPSGAEVRESGAAQISARQAQAARGAAQESARALQTARDMLADAQSAAREAESRTAGAAQAVTDAEARFDDKKATGADVEAARSTQREAQSTVEATAKALVFAKAEVARREKNAATAQNYAQSSAADAAKTLAGARLDAPPPGEASEGADESPPAGSALDASPSPRGGGARESRVTLERAIQFAGAALDESRRASREAERIHDEIEGYQSQVTRSNSRIESATQDLASAQQSVMDSVPRPRFTASYAPASGIVTWISRLAREVGAGDAIFGIARNQRLVARFEDKSGLWRALKSSAKVPAFVVDAPAANAQVTATPGSAQPVAAISRAVAPIAAKPETAIPLGAGHQVELQISEIQAPKAAGEAAKMSGAIVSPPAGTSSPAGSPAGAEILISLPRPNQKATLSVPVSALIQRGAARYLAVLAPLSPTEIAKKEALASETTKTDGARTGNEIQATATPVATQGEMFHLRWARVQTGRSDGLRFEITGGVQAGARVVSAPEDLEAMGFAPPLAPQSTPQSTVFDTRNATPAPNVASNPAPEEDLEQAGAQAATNLDAGVLVRLTALAT